MSKHCRAHKDFPSDVDLSEDSAERDSSKNKLSEKKLPEHKVSNRGLSECEVSEIDLFKDSFKEYSASDEAARPHNYNELATNSGLTLEVSKQVKTELPYQDKDTIHSKATLSNQLKTFVGKGIEMTSEEHGFLERYRQAKQVCPSSLKCTTCLCKLFLDNPENIQIHPVLGVLLCKGCREFYCNTPFTKDVKGHDEHCRWCAEARAIIRCHTCSNAFCKACLKRCLGHAPLAEVTGSKYVWNCLICNDLPLWAPRALARTVMTSIKSSSERSLEAFNSNDPTIWLPNMIDEVEKLAEYCKTLAKKTRISWSTDNESSESKNRRSTHSRKETDKIKVIGCCRQLRKAVVATHLNMKSLEKKLLSKFQKTYGTTADIDVSAAGSNLKQESIDQENKGTIIKARNSTTKSGEKEFVSEQWIKSTLIPVECTSGTILPAESNSKMAISSNLDSKDLDSDKSVTQDLNQQARQYLLKYSSDSDTRLSSNSDASLSELESNSRVKAKSQSNYSSTKDDPKLRFKCVVVLDRITNANIIIVDKQLDGIEQGADLRMKNPLKMKRRACLESESETKMHSEKEDQLKRQSAIPKNQSSIKKRFRITDMWSSSSSDEGKPNVEMTAGTQFSILPLVPDRVDAVRRALLATSGSDTDVLTCNTENEESFSAVLESTQRNPDDHDHVAIKTENTVKKIDVVDLTSDDEGPGKMSHIETDKLLHMSLHDPETNTQTIFKEKGKKKKAMKRGKKKHDNHSSSHETSESEVEKRKLKKIRLSPSVVDGNSDDGDDDESDNEERTGSKLPLQTQIAVIKNSGNSSSSSIENLKLSQQSETVGSKRRKAIRKIMADTSLTDETKAAAKEEENRKRRIAERQKIYNEAFVCSSAITDAHTNNLVLDFERVSKKELVIVDKSIVTKLKLHQVEGVKFMWDACFESVERIKEHPGSGCILAHCMGLGKSLQVVALVHTVLKNKACQVDRVLVVCPVNTIRNWVNEFKIWLGAKSGVDVYDIIYSKHNKIATRMRTLSMWLKSGGVLIIGYAMYLHLVSDSSKIVKSQEERDLYARSLIDPGPQLVVCDEGHCLKNEKTASYEAINKIATRRRIVLTGTPLQNNLEEYFCMVQFVKPNLLGTINEFKNRFANPIKNGQAADSNDHDVRIMKRRAHVLHKMLEDSVQRFDYKVLTPFLPPKHEYVISVKLSELQIKMYQHYLEKHVKGGPKNPNRVKAAGLFADFQELGRVWTHPKALLVAEVSRNKSKIKTNMDWKASTMDVTGDHGEPSLYEESDGPTCSYMGSEKESEIATTSKSYELHDAPLNQPTAHNGSSVTTALPWWSPFCQEDMSKMEFGGKFILLMDILHQCEHIGDKVLVFSQSLVSLCLIEEFLAIENEQYKKDRANRASNDLPQEHADCYRWRINQDYFRLDGQTSSELRASACNVFNDPSNSRARLFLISTKAGGVGINLIAANRVVIFDASWNPSHDVQSIFRVYRFGQQKPCYIYRFLAQGTMEEKIYDRQVTKLSLSCRVVDEQQIERHFNSADLKDLYLFEPNSHLRRPTPILPKDRLLAELIIQRKDCIVTYHEHDSLLENKSEEELTEIERKAAWDDFENEKRGVNLTINDPSEFANMTRFADIIETLVGRTVAGVPLTSIATLIYNSNPDIIREDFLARLQMEQMESFSAQQAVIASAFAASGQRPGDSRRTLINQRLLATDQKQNPCGNSPQRMDLPGQSDIDEQVPRNPGSEIATTVNQLTNSPVQHSSTDELSKPNDAHPVYENLQ